MADKCNTTDRTTGSIPILLYI
ncbi:MAG: hypothetical protein SCABRO_03943, partial [Candidatus Scalindua brodae]